MIADDPDWRIKSCRSPCSNTYLCDIQTVLIHDDPFASVCLVTAFDCRVGYNCTLENHFDIATMDEELALFKPSDNLYDAVARAWDSPSVMETSPSDMGITWDRPGYRIRRSSYEERRGAVSVRPSEVNSLRPCTPSPDHEDFPVLQSPSTSLHSHESASF
ncbi:hypothetical protein BDR07DRAFT_1495504 [Suillus spraguei]|nr:hypothetical protein BDR07DRAFT_1495504 [Suillus spraguei]